MLFAIPLNILMKPLHKKQNLNKKVWTEVFETLGHLLLLAGKQTGSHEGLILDPCTERQKNYHSPL